MMITEAQWNKIDLYMGLDEEIIKRVNYWINLNPKDDFDVDEFIYWHKEKTTILKKEIS